MTTKPTPILAKMEKHFAKYIAAPAQYHFVAALWAAMTHIYRDLDTVPYLCATSLTKRSGKTLYMVDLLKPLCHKPLNATGMSGAVLYRSLEQENGGVLFGDEAEALGSEAQSQLRRAMNVGYKRGQTIPVTVGGEVKQFPCFGPKCFVLIGDVNDTLRDRSIVFYLKRASQLEMMKLARFVSVTVDAESLALVTELGAVMAERQSAIVDTYRTHAGLEWLSARDAEIWLSLFAVCEVLAPQRIDELARIATDMCADKLQESQTYSADAAADAEKRAQRAEFCVRLIQDLSALVKGKSYLLSADAVPMLHAIPTAPWRRYKGRGLTDQDIGYLLPAVLQAKNIKVQSKPKQIVKRGWSRFDIEQMVRELGEVVTALEATDASQK